MADRDGFEFKLPDDTEATFFPWAASTGGKDLQIIDAFTHMPLQEFMEASQDPHERSRGIMLLAAVGMSIRAKFPDWTAERIIRTVQNLDILEDLTWISSEEDGVLPPPETQKEERSAGTNSSSNSSPSATPTATSPSETSKPIRA